MNWKKVAADNLVGSAAVLTWGSIIGFWVLIVPPWNAIVFLFILWILGAAGTIIEMRRNEAKITALREKEELRAWMVKEAHARKESDFPYPPIRRGKSKIL